MRCGTTATHRRSASTSRSSRSVPPRKTVPRRHVDGPGEHLGQGRLARAGPPDQRVRAAAGEGQADVAQRRPAGRRRRRRSGRSGRGPPGRRRPGPAPPAGSCGASRSSCTRPQAPSAYCSSGTIRLTCSTVRAEGRARAARSRSAGRRRSGRWPAPRRRRRTTTAMPTRIDAGGDRGDPGRHPPHPPAPGAAPRLARRAYRRSTYGRARLVRTSSWPWIDSSITAARSDQASSSAIRAGAIRAVGRRSADHEHRGEQQHRRRRPATRRRAR